MLGGVKEGEKHGTQSIERSSGLGLSRHFTQML